MAKEPLPYKWPQAIDSACQALRPLLSAVVSRRIIRNLLTRAAQFRAAAPLYEKPENALAVNPKGSVSELANIANTV